MRSKVYFLINSLSAGGAEKVLTIIANKLSEQGFQVEIIFLENNEFYGLSKNVKKTYLSNLKGNEYSIKKFLYIFILAWKLKKYIKNNKINLIQSHMFRANYVNILAKIMGGNHKVQIVNHGFVNKKIKNFFIKLLYNKSDLIISVSKVLKQQLNKELNIKTSHIIINNPFNINEINKLANEEVKELNFDASKIYLVSVGRLIPLKKHDILIKSLLKLPENVEAIIIGEGEEKENLMKLVKNLNLEKRVHFIGKVSNPYKFIKRSNILVNCSSSESFSNILIEAMICNVPVISSDCGGPREILAPNTDVNKQLKYDDDIELAKYGILYPIGNVEKLVKAIKLLLNNKELKENFIKKARKRAEDFSINKVIEQYKEVLLYE